MAFELPPLPYAEDALEPHIDAKTMGIHHDKHHAGYTNNLNNALAGNPGLASKSVSELLANLDSVPEAIRTAVRNNGGGYANHTLFWSTMGPNSGGQPTGEYGIRYSHVFDSGIETLASPETLVFVEDSAIDITVGALLLSGERDLRRSLQDTLGALGKSLVESKGNRSDGLRISTMD